MKYINASIPRIPSALVCAVLWIGLTLAPTTAWSLCIELQLAKQNSQQIANEFEQYLANLKKADPVGATERLRASQRKMADLRAKLDSFNPTTPTETAQATALNTFHSLMERLIHFRAGTDIVDRDVFVQDWRNFLVEIGNLQAGSSFRSGLSSSQRSFSSIFDGLDPQTLQGYSVLYGELPYTNNVTMAANHFVATAAEAKVRVILQDLATTALSRAVVRINNNTFTSAPYENPGPQGPPYNPGEVAARIEAGEAGYQWGSVQRPNRGTPRITVDDAGAYVNWLDSTHFNNALDPYVKEQIRLATDSFSIPYDIDGVAGGGAIPLFNSVPGTHAEIFAMNEVFGHIRTTNPGLFSTPTSPNFINVAAENATLDAISVATFDFSAKTAVARHGNAFRACVHCESIIPSRINVFSGAKEEPEFFPTSP